ncbi:MAG: hypothetical protein NXI24_02770 [bacterium]|nr:hypothetical protein [bacterium]
MPTPPANRVIEARQGVEYLQIGKDSIESFTNFVFNHFVKRIGKRQQWRPSEADYRTMLSEEQSLATTGFFIAARIPGGRIVGAMRAAQWSPDMRLATEKIFHIDPAVIAHQRGVPAESVWHVSQMCVDTEFLVAQNYSWRVGIEIMRTIVKHLFRAVAPHNGRIALLESDDQINAYLNRFLQIETTPLGSTRDYIGQTQVAIIDLDIHYGLPYIQAKIGSRILR